MKAAKAVARPCRFLLESDTLSLERPKRDMETDAENASGMRPTAGSGSRRIAAAAMLTGRATKKLMIRSRRSGCVATIAVSDMLTDTSTEDIVWIGEQME